MASHVGLLFMYFITEKSSDAYHFSRGSWIRIDFYDHMIKTFLDTNELDVYIMLKRA